MVDLIESKWSRVEYPDVFNSLVGINEAQTRSLTQHVDSSINHVEDISCEKGGASVLADAYLVAGKLSIEDAIWADAIGYSLQILDDIQDVIGDTKNGHHTQITLMYQRKIPLDRICTRLLRSFDRLINPAYYNFSPTQDRDYYELRTAMAVMIGTMVLKTVSKRPELYTEQYIKDLEDLSPIPFSSLKKVVLVKRLITLIRQGWM